jgi:hypothetical protein
MSFISRGDFMLPFEFSLYWLKHFYMWSYQTGAMNIDGIIRLPSRFFNLIVFAASGNIITSYFYLLFSMAVIFMSFYMFAGHFLDIKNKNVRILGALFFACNPIFLGYLAKVGLIVGAAMLPLCLVVLRQAFLKQQFRYFILYILLLNVSFIHPFTLTINLAVSGLYALNQLRTHYKFIFSNKAKTLGVLALGFVLNAYFILPILSLGTVNKSALSDELNTAPVDHTTLVDFANTRDPLTAFSLSRNVFLDFRYFNEAYQQIYLAAVFVFYLVLLGLYIYNEQRLSKLDRKRIVLLFSVFLGLLLLSMSTFFDINILIKFLVGLPGGWMFRSPLKWQLYIPLVLSIMLCLLLQRTTVKRVRKLASTTIVATVVFMGAFLGADIFRNLLVPSEFNHLKALQSQNLKHKNLLFVSDTECFSFLQNHLDIVSEMNQIFVSNDLQVKRISGTNINSVNIASYDYIFGCSDGLASPLRGEQQFRHVSSFANNRLALYQNHEPQPYIYASKDVFALNKVENLGDKRAFLSKRGQQLDFVNDALGHPVADLQDPFEALSLGNIQDDKIINQIPLANAGQQTLSLQNQNQAPLYAQVEQGEISLSHQPQPGFKLFNESLDLNTSGTLQFTYLSKQRRQNLIGNGSFEKGLWQNQVGDCYAYDDKPAIAMRLNTKDAAEGAKSLELSAQNHIACTGLPKIKLKGAKRYLLHFKYKNIGKRSFAGYQVRFDDPYKTYVTDHLPQEGNGWQELTKEVTVPVDAKTLKLTLYAYPDYSGEGGHALFDDFTIMQIPELQGSVYLTSQPETRLQKPQNISYIDKNPTQKQVHIKRAAGPFYLAMRDTYHSFWEARAGSSKLSDKNHIKLNGFMNGWFVNPEQLCRSAGANCTRHNDGSYDMTLELEFAPQRWFYAGLMLSSIGFVGIIGYFGYLAVQKAQKGGNRYWRWH